MHEWASAPRPTGRWASSSGGLLQHDYNSLSGREYGFKAGVGQLMDVLTRHGVNATVMVSGLSAELWPESVRSLKARGHEIATHQWDQAVHPPKYKSREEERELLLKSIVAIEKATGERPLGYMSPGPSPTINTLDVIAGEDFIWTGDYQDADVPYVINVGSKKLVSLGYVRPSFTDNDIMPLGLAAGFQQLKDEFDATYEESARHPMKFAYAIHTHGGSTPGMAKLLDNFLQHVESHSGVWFCRCIDMANFWLTHVASDASI